MASAAQGFIQMVTMAAISAILVPLVVGRIADFALGQAALFGLALAFWGAVRWLHRRGRTDCGQ